jgi:hypothetical protein
MLNVVTHTHGSCSRCLFLSALLSLPLPATNLQAHTSTHASHSQLSNGATRHAVQTCLHTWLPCVQQFTATYKLCAKQPLCDAKP